jgi:speckle-type POZ protein
MLRANMKERAEAKIIIEDFPPSVIQHLLEWIYTDKVVDLDNGDTAKALLPAAEKYLLQDLKIDCEISIAKKMTVESAIEDLILADMYNATILKEAATKFVKM